MTGASTIRPAAVAGMFYPGDAQELQQQIAGLFKAVQPTRIDGKVRGLISPHAGYIYSGFTAAHGYALLRGQTYGTVVVISPSHRDYFEGVSVYSGDAYETPLGRVSVNKRLRETLVQACAIVGASRSGHQSEHALEVQLPFLQQALGSFSLLPLVIGDQRRRNCVTLGEALAQVLKSEDALMVASTDLSHYYPASVADRLDSIVIDDVRQFDADRLMSHLESGEAEACGGGPVVAMMTALKNLGVTKVQVLHHCNSGDVTGDRQGVVGYLSAVAFG